jgi:heptosyltransferase-2
MRREIKRILVITKYRFIGDTMVAVPTLRALKERWPNSDVALLSGARACELLQNCPYVDGFFEFDPYRKSDKGIGQYLKLIFQLKSQHFDLVLVLNRSFHSALTAALCGARVRAGWSGFECRDFMLTHKCQYGKERQESECFLDVFRSAGGEYDRCPDLQFWLSDAEIEDGARILPEGKFLIGIQPGATHQYKQWPIEYFVELCGNLCDSNDLVQPILIGGPDEVTIAAQFMSSASPELAERTMNLVGKLTLRTTLSVVSQLNAFIGNDTAIRHAAVAANTPSIGLFGPTSRTKWGNDCPPRHVVLHADSGRMEDLGVDTVLAAASKWPSTVALPIGVRNQTSVKYYEGSSGFELRKERAMVDKPLLLDGAHHE